MQVKRFLPFLSGNRSCIGMSLAQLNYTTAAATLLSRFSFRLADDVSAAKHFLVECMLFYRRTWHLSGVRCAVQNLSILANRRYQHFRVTLLKC